MTDDPTATTPSVTRRDVLKRTTATVGLAAGGLAAMEPAAAQSGQGIVVGRCPIRQYFVVLGRVGPGELECGEEVRQFEQCYRIQVLKPRAEEGFCLSQERTLCTNTGLESETVYEFQGQLSCECDGGQGVNCRVIYTPADRMFEGLQPCEPSDCKKCVDFSGFQPDTQASFSFDVGQFTFDRANPQSTFTSYFRDAWPSGSPDGNIELQYPDDGVAIDVPTAISGSVVVVPFASGPIELEAYDSAGNLVDADQTPGSQQQKYSLSVQGQDITQLVVKGGENEGLLLEVCVETEA